MGIMDRLISSAEKCESENFCHFDTLMLLWSLAYAISRGAKVEELVGVWNFLRVQVRIQHFQRGEWQRALKARAF